MTYTDSLSLATQRALDWDDLPQDLLPLVIVSSCSPQRPGFRCLGLHTPALNPTPAMSSRFPASILDGLRTVSGDGRGGGPSFFAMAFGDERVTAG